MKTRTTNVIAAGLFAGVALCLATPTHAALVQHHTFDVDVSDSFGRTSTAVGDASISGVDAAVGTGSLVLDGTGDYVSLDAVGALNTATDSESTLALWVDVQASKPLSGIFTSNAYAGDAIHLNHKNVPDFEYAGPAIGGNTTTTSATVPTGWVHLAIVYNGVDTRLYVNGSLEVTGAASSFNYGDASSIGAWAGDGGRDLQGRIDDLRIYDNALSASEVAALAVPEPSSLALLGLGGLLMARRRR